MNYPNGIQSPKQDHQYRNSQINIDPFHQASPNFDTADVINLNTDEGQSRIINDSGNSNAPID